MLTFKPNQWIPMASPQKKFSRHDRQNAVRYFMSVFLPVWVIGSLGLWLFYASESRKNKEELREGIKHTLALQKESVVLDFMLFVSDLKFLSGMVEVSGFCDSADPALKQQLAREMAVFLKSKGIYAQAQVIDVSGQEVIRVDYNFGEPSIALDEKLQDASKRHYFLKTIEIGRNDIYISPLDLNVEPGGIERPVEPMIRLGTPLVNMKGEKKGIILINYFGKKMLWNLNRLSAHQTGDYMLLNRNGYWIKGRGAGEPWGFFPEDGGDKTFRQSFAQEWERISGQEKGQFLTANGFFSFMTIFPFKGIQQNMDLGSWRYLFSNLVSEDSYYWKLVAHVPRNILEAQERQAGDRFRFVFLVMTGSILASYIFLILAQHYRERSADLEIEKSKMDQILNYGENVRTITNLNKLIDFVIEQASMILESERCSLMLLDEDTGELSIRGAIGLDSNIIRESKVGLGQEIAGLVAAEGNPMLVEVIDQDKRIQKRTDHFYRSKSFLSVPIKLDHKLIGVVNVTEKIDRRHPTYTELDLKILMAIVRQAAVAIENAQLSKELKYLTITDPLTNLYNYRHLMECLAYELKRVRRFSRSLCLLIMDVDDFKEYNDVFGQVEGNGLLKKIAEVLTRNLREVDILCRYAGDEFVVILPDTELQEVKLIAEKIRGIIANMEFRKSMTVSIGIVKGLDGMSRHDLILKADAALHKAKKEGKNRTYCQDKSV